MYTLYSITYLDTYEKCYKKIITINNLPEGPLKNFVKQITLPKLNDADIDTPCCPREKCVYALYNYNTNHLMSVDEFPNLFSFLTENNYIINSALTDMMNKSDIRVNKKNIICFFTYTNSS
jgi:hypothetical protein